jgi:hypothetical protein
LFGSGSGTPGTETVGSLGSVTFGSFGSGSVAFRLGSCGDGSFTVGRPCPVVACVVTFFTAPPTTETIPPDLCVVPVVVVDVVATDLDVPV